MIFDISIQTAFTVKLVCMNFGKCTKDVYSEKTFVTFEFDERFTQKNSKLK